VALLLILKDFRLTALIPVVIALFFAFAPDRVTDRMMSMFDMRDPTVRDRVAMLNTGRAMAADHPLTGVGPSMVEQRYAEYRDPNGVNATNPHLHNVPMQIAAERGLPALGIWLWAIGTMLWTLWRLFRGGGDRVLAAAGLATVIAMLGAGLFEYNFGDSEFLMLLLVVVTLPFAARRDHAAATARA
jgi:O-antigen ligase